MIESIAEKFKRLGCCFLEKVEVSSNNAWINDLFLQPTQDRKRLLLWCLKTVDPSFELMRLDEFLSASGICNSPNESKSFVSGEMSRNRQITVWEAFARLIDEEKLEFEDITEMHAKNCTFIDALAENVNFEQQTKAPLEITPYHLERELKSRKMADAPQIKVFKNVLGLAQAEKSHLLQFDQNENAEESDDHDVLSNLETKSDEIFEKKKGFDTKFRTELEPWLTGRSVTSLGTKDRPEVGTMAESLQKMSDHFSNNLTITNSAHQVTKASEEIHNVLAYSTLVDNSVLDIEHLNLLSDLNLTRAPAAS
eukprot:GFUD01039354.1.p1 GENE.GFUD01039354.1~~GFUD01039354.1.p1  ORF type:complete len:310 (+),score=57.11 GFUD01039354.1:2082-3011(+)